MNRLKELRKEKGLLQKEVAQIIGVSTQSYNYYETWTNKPDPDILIKLANLYEVSIDYLLGRTEDIGSVTILPTTSDLSDIDQNLLTLFHSMTHAQQVRFLAYGEGITGITVSKIPKI